MNSSTKIFNKITKDLEKVVAANKKYEVATSSIPSAPDTSKFRATVSGFIRLEKNVEFKIGYSYYKVPLVFRIGGGVDYHKSKEIREKVISIVKKYQQDLPLLNFSESFGTNYDSIGIYVKS